MFQRSIDKNHEENVYFNERPEMINHKNKENEIYAGRFLKSPI